MRKVDDPRWRLLVHEGALAGPLAPPHAHQLRGGARRETGDKGAVGTRRTVRERRTWAAAAAATPQPAPRSMHSGLSMGNVIIPPL